MKRNLGRLSGRLFFWKINYLFLAVLCATVLLASAAPAGAALSSEERQLLNLVNQKRRTVGVQPLKWGPRLKSAALKHSVSLSRDKSTAASVQSRDGLAVNLRASGVIRWKRAGQTATSAGNARIAFNKWLGRGVYRQAMLDPNYTHMGVGIVSGGPNGKLLTMNLAQDPVIKRSAVRLSSEQRKLFNLLNAERRERGLRPLKWGPRLANSGTAHSRDMVDNNFFSHVSPTKGTLADRLYATGLKGWKKAGENIAGSLNVEVAFKLWMESDGHRLNMLDREYTHVGLGIVEGGPYGSMITLHLAQDPVTR